MARKELRRLGKRAGPFRQYGTTIPATSADLMLLDRRTYEYRVCNRNRLDRVIARVLREFESVGSF